MPFRNEESGLRAAILELEELLSREEHELYLLSSPSRRFLGSKFNRSAEPQQALQSLDQLRARVEELQESLDETRSSILKINSAKTLATSYRTTTSLEVVAAVLDKTSMFKRKKGETRWVGLKAEVSLVQQGEETLICFRGSPAVKDFLVLMSMMLGIGLAKGFWLILPVALGLSFLSWRVSAHANRSNLLELERHLLPKLESPAPKVRVSIDPDEVEVDSADEEGAEVVAYVSEEEEKEFDSHLT